MSKRRPPKAIWEGTLRPIVWKRDGGKCVRCGVSLKLNECHIDRIKSGKLGSNAIKNLRTLCRRCHVLRADFRHRGMIAKALEDGIIPPDWRNHLWDED